MRTATRKFALSAAALVLSIALFQLSPRPSLAQYQYPGLAPTTPDAQRNAMNAVRTQVAWLRNATQTASAYDTGALGLVWSQFQSVCGSYNAFTATLTPQQAAEGANEWAELSSGLNILQEAFSNYQDDVASGRSPALALRDMCQVLNQAAGVWLQEFNRDCGRLRVGW